MVVQWLRLCFRVLSTFTGCTGSIPGRELPHVVRHGKEKKSVSLATGLFPQYTNAHTALHLPTLCYTPAPHHTAPHTHTEPSTSPPFTTHTHPHPHTQPSTSPPFATHTHTHTHTHHRPSQPCTQCTSSGLPSFLAARSEQVWGGGLEGGGSSSAQALPPHIIMGDRIQYVGVQISRAVHLDVS